MQLAKFHAVIFIRKLFALFTCFLFFLDPYPNDVIYLLVWENKKKKGRESKTMENLFDTMKGNLSRKVTVTLETLITKDVHGLWISFSIPGSGDYISRSGAWKSSLLRKRMLFTTALGRILYCKTLLNF